MEISGPAPHTTEPLVDEVVHNQKKHVTDLLAYPTQRPIKLGIIRY